MQDSARINQPWRRALSWSERGASTGTELSDERGNNELTQRRLQQWETQLGEGREQDAAAILRARGWSRDAFHSLLSSADGRSSNGSNGTAAVRGKSLSEHWPQEHWPQEHWPQEHWPQEHWPQSIEQAYEQEAAAPEPASPWSDEHPRAGFLSFVQPMIHQARARLRTGLLRLRDEFPEAPFSIEIEDSLLQPMPAVLIHHLSRTLTLELHVARLRGQLAGDSPEARFHSFVRRLADKQHAKALLQEYPVLARQIWGWLDGWVQSSLEMLQRLANDWELLHPALLDGSFPGRVVAVKGQLGDPHRGGRSVALLTFENGDRLIYKPKALAADQHLQELLSWLNNRNEGPSLRPLRLLDRGQYGWVEYLAPTPCRDEAGVARFYQRQGAYLAIFYVLGGTDFHYENLIAVGEHPMPVDLESLFSSIRSGPDEEKSGPALQAMGDSVLRIGMLPQRSWAKGEGGGIDLSGLGFQAGQLTPHRVPGWAEAGTDQMRFVRQRVPLQGGDHLPALDEQPAAPGRYRQQIEQGFADAYRTMLAHRQELLSPDGPLAAFAEDEVRVILRPTRTYGLLLGESFHPDLLRDAVDRDIHFDRLWVGVSEFDALLPVVEAEQRDLRRGDIPIFTTRPGTRNIQTSDGSTIPDFFDQSGLELARRRIADLGEADLERQLWLVGAALSLIEVEAGVMASGRFPLPEAPPATKPELLAEAQRIGDRLATLALGETDQSTAEEQPSNLSWAGLGPYGGSDWAITPIGPDLYSGLPGVILFLAHLGQLAEKQADRQRYTQLAWRGMATLRPHVPAASSLLPGLGAFSGLGGLIWSFAHLGHLWSEPDLIEEAIGLSLEVPDLLSEDRDLDLIGGAAGCLLAVLALHQVHPRAELLAAAQSCGEHLLATAKTMPRGIAWQPAAAVGDQPLAGISHGASGMALALARLAERSGEQRYQEAAVGALAYERELFFADAGNWQDLRPYGELDDAEPRQNDNSSRFSVAWCHGAPGIGLARLRLMTLISDRRLSQEAEVAVATTGHLGLDGNHSLCHGAMGNLELLALAERRLEHSVFPVSSMQLAGSLLASMQQNGWLCGVPGQVQTPGLMTGLAGIGYGLLRLAAPERVPSVLTLEAPTQDA